MGQAIAVRTDFTSEEVRQLAARVKDASQARRLLAIAAVLDGASREDAEGMDRQTLCRHLKTKNSGCGRKPANEYVSQSRRWRLDARAIRESCQKSQPSK
jgi:hypothetical protein